MHQEFAPTPPPTFTIRSEQRLKTIGVIYTTYRTTVRTGADIDSIHPTYQSNLRAGSRLRVYVRVCAVTQQQTTTTTQPRIFVLIKTNRMPPQQYQENLNNSNNDRSPPFKSTFQVTNNNNNNNNINNVNSSSGHVQELQNHHMNNNHHHHHATTTSAGPNPPLQSSTSAVGVPILFPVEADPVDDILLEGKRVNTSFAPERYPFHSALPFLFRYPNPQPLVALSLLTRLFSFFFDFPYYYLENRNLYIKIR